MTHMLVHLMESYRSLRLYSLLFSLFVCCSSDLIIFIILTSSSLILFSACSNMTLNPSSEFFLYQSLHFSVPNFFLVHYVFCLFIDISVCSYIIFLTFSLLSFSSSAVFKVVVLTSLSRRFMVKYFSGTVFVGLFFFFL